MAPELTPRLLRLPEAVASRFARRGTILFEEMAGNGTLALVVALRDYDPARGSLQTFAFWRVYGAVTNTLPRSLRRGKGARHSPVSEARGLPGRAPAPHARADARDELDVIMAPLKPRERRILWMCCAEGYDRVEVGRLLSKPVSREAVRQALNKAMKKARQEAGRR